MGHAFSHGFHPDHTQRLAAYWSEALGGPPAYSGSFGDETSVVRLHAGNGEHEEMDARAIACFDLALEDAGLDGDGQLRQTLHDYFAWATTTGMARYPASADDVPDGLTISRLVLGRPSGRVMPRVESPIPRETQGCGDHGRVMSIRQSCMCPERAPAVLRVHASERRGVLIA